MLVQDTDYGALYMFIKITKEVLNHGQKIKSIGPEMSEDLWNKEKDPVCFPKTLNVLHAVRG